MTPRTCSICKFYKASSTYFGVCRRFPPKYDPDDEAFDLFPSVGLGAWCGEWKLADSVDYINSPIQE